MKKVISIFLSLVMLLSIVSVVDFSAYADVQTGKCGDEVTYSLDTSTGVLTISGTGKMTDYAMGNPFSKLNVKTVIIENGVTSIGNQAFDYCTVLTNITIPNTITSIGDLSFGNCTSLTSITIPDSVISIDDNAFEGCTSLSNITIPNSVTSIGNDSFANCENLTNVTIGNGVTNLGIRAFNNCAKLKSVVIPDKITKIGYASFSDCKSLTSVTISDSVTSIDNEAFNNCASLENVTIGKNIANIGEDVFRNCEKIKRIDYRGTIAQWEAINIDTGNYFLISAIIKCSDGIKGNGKAITIDSLTYELGNYTASLLKYDDSLQNLTIPKSIEYEGCEFAVTNIDNRAFAGCENLTDITIPDSVTSIGESAFDGCTSLVSVTLSKSITTIEYSTFFGCSSLTSIEIPKSVTTIVNFAFCNCTNLTDVYYDGTQSEWNKINIGHSNEFLTNASLHCSSTPTPEPTPTPTPEPTPTPNPAPQPSTQPIQETPQQVAQQTAQQPLTQNNTTAAQTEVAKPKSVSPKTVKAAKKAVSVEWKKVGGVKGYQVQVATDKKFKKNKKTVTIKKQKTTKTTVKKLKAKKKYYVRVRTYKIVNGKKVYSAWSKVKSVKTK